MMMPLTCLTLKMLKASLMEMLQICLMWRKMLMVMVSVVKSQSGAVLVLFTSEAQGGGGYDLEYLGPWRGGSNGPWGLLPPAPNQPPTAIRGVRNTTAVCQGSAQHNEYNAVYHCVTPVGCP